MKNLFLGTSFSGHVNYETGQVYPEFKTSVEGMLDALRANRNFNVFCAVEHEGWIVSDAPPEIGVQKDLIQLDRSDIMIAYLPPGVMSEGLQFEMGEARKDGKPVVLATETGTTIGYFNQGLINLGLITHVEFSDPSEVVAMASASLNAKGL